jgi:hypothetical protein
MKRSDQIAFSIEEIEKLKKFRTSEFVDESKLFELNEIL